MNIVLALLPFVVALVMLAVLQRSGLQTGLVTLAATIAIVLAVPSFRLAPGHLLLALGQGIATSLTVLTVLFPALLLYHLQQTSGAMTVLAQGITRLCPHRDLQVLLLVLGLAPFIECVSGFGVGTVVIIPILASLSIEPLQVATLGLLGQITVPWGALAVGTTLGAELTGLDAGLLGANTALLTALLPIGFGLVTLAMSGGKKAVQHWWLAALIAGGVLACGEWLFSQVPGVELAGVLASVPTLALLAIWDYLISRRSHVARQTVVLSENVENAPDANIAGKEKETVNPRLWQAIAPYVILTAFLLITRLVVPLQNLLQNQGVLAIPSLNLHLPLLYTPGFWVLLAALTTAPILGIDLAELRGALARTWHQFVPGAIAIIGFLATAQVMLVSGMTATLGSAAATLGSNYVWLAPWLGAFGGWLTGSNAGGNAMFALLQKEASGRAGLPLQWTMAAQNGSGSIATMVAPARVVLATTAAGIAGKEGYLLRKLGPLVLAAVAVIMVLLWIIVGIR